MVEVRYGTAPAAQVPVELYTGKHATCEPFNIPCVKKVKGLTKGTTKQNGRALLKATFSKTELVCAEASKGGTLVQSCQSPFPSRVILQLK